MPHLRTAHSSQRTGSVLAFPHTGSQTWYKMVVDGIGRRQGELGMESRPICQGWHRRSGDNSTLWRTGKRQERHTLPLATMDGDAQIRGKERQGIGN